MSDYPEHEKLAKLTPDNEVVRFLQWLYGKHFFVVEKDKRWLNYVRQESRTLLYGFYGIDLTTLYREKQAMLEDMRKETL